MWTYGDPEERITYADFWRAIGPRLRHAQQSPDDQDGRRALLIEVGRLEQGLADVGHVDAPVIAELADRLAEGRVGPHVMPDATPLRLKVPEGFAFYALYPEQYRLAAERWASSASGGTVLVLGLRSIGTTLSAVVAARLRQLGHDVIRMTGRPTGDPFSRVLDLAPFPKVGDALIVDEGPGFSGSSMAGAGEALLQAGVPFDRITLMPGHGQRPRRLPPNTVDRWWDLARKIVVSPEEIRWGGQALVERLISLTEERFASSVSGIEDLSGGRWRHRESTPAHPAFERPKLKMRLANGQAILWKFEGLDGGADHAFARLQRLSKLGWTPPPLMRCLGYVATKWIEGEAPSSVDVVSYVHAAAGPEIGWGAWQDDFDRLRSKTLDNVREAVGTSGRRAASRMADAALQAMGPRPTRTYGDGRLDPHEWVQDRFGRIWKTDAAGHDRDHTYVGRQSVSWDFAGAYVEWELPTLPTSDDLPTEWVRFHLVAYAAFRLAMAEISGISSDRYFRVLTQELGTAQTQS